MSKLTHEILMEIRKENKLSRKALSFLSGFNENTILAYERNMRKPSKEYIRFMSLYFDVSEDYMFSTLFLWYNIQSINGG